MTKSVFTLFFEHWCYAIKIAWPWILLLAILYGPMLRLSEAALDSKGTAQDISLSQISAFLLATLVAMAGWSSIAVLWHRRLLRNENLPGFPVNLGPQARKYLLRFIFIAIAVIAPSIIIGVISSGKIETNIVNILVKLINDPESYPIFAFIGMILTMALTVISLRLSVALPAAALGEGEVTPGRAWSATSGNGFRLLIVFVLAGSPAYISSLLSFWLTVRSGWLDSLLGALLLSFLAQATNFVWVMIGVTLLSVAYAFLIEERGPDTLAIAATADA